MRDRGLKHSIRSQRSMASGLALGKSWVKFAPRVYGSDRMYARAFWLWMNCRSSSGGDPRIRTICFSWSM